MKLISYVHEGVPGFGVLVGEGVVSAGRLGSAEPSIRGVLEADTLAQLDARAAGAEPDLDLAAVSLAPVIPDPPKILCVGLNYRDHRDEVGRDRIDHPTIFTRFADSQIAAGGPIVCPPAVAKLDYEGELALVIGRGGRNISEDEALDHVIGYACYNDFSARDWQQHSTQWTAGKNLPGTGAFGPYLATVDEVGEVTALALETRVNGDVRQSATVADLLFTIPELICYISTFTPLSPGDVIVTGTPGGVGLFREPPVFLKPGDVVEVEISSLGLLRNRIETASE